MMHFMLHRFTRILPVLFLFCCLPALAQEAEAEQCINLKIGKDTTFFTGPVNDDGTIDYVAALNQHYGEGVKNKENAFALMMQLLPQWQDEDEVDQTHRQRMYRALGLPVDRGIPRVQLWHTFAIDQDLTQEQVDQIFEEGLAGPWSAEEFPHLKAWVDASEPAIALLIDSLGCEGYYAPLIRVEDDEPMISVLLPHLGMQRQVGKLLCIRAWCELQAGNDEEVIATLKHLHRMGDLVSSEPPLISRLVGISLQSMQTPLIEAIAERGVLPDELAKDYLNQLASIEPIDSIPDAIAVHERSMVLDAVLRSWAGKDSGLAMFMGSLGFLDRAGDELTPANEAMFQKVEALSQSPYFDINTALRYINHQFDRQQVVAKQHGIKARRDAFQDFSESLSEQAPMKLVFILINISAEEELPKDWTVKRYSESVAKVYARMLMPSLGKALRTQDRLNARRLVEATAIALLGYREQHGELPDSLDALVPTYFDTVPIDFATDKPLVFRVNDDGSAIVYSLGNNLKDDGGVDDYNDGDIAIRIGVPQR